MVGELLKQGFKDVRSADIKPLDEWYQVHRAAKNIAGDKRLGEAGNRRLKAALKTAKSKLASYADQVSGAEERDAKGLATARDAQRLAALLQKQQALLGSLENYRQAVGDALARAAAELLRTRKA